MSGEQDGDLLESLRVPVGRAFDLADFDPDETLGRRNKACARREMADYGKRLRELQYRLYAEGRRSLLIVLQAMDAGGKDGTIRHVMGYMNPQGCRVAAFKVPTPRERAHDFLWRVHPHAPGHGQVAVFNRSHYEAVLIERVRQLAPHAVWRRRYEQINAFEDLLVSNGTRVLKFFLHISPEEQLKRFRKRLENPVKQWKISESDYTERRYWGDYQAAYAEALQRCNSDAAPWFIIPANRKWFRNLAVSRILVETLEAMDPRLPSPGVDLERIRRLYLAELERSR